MIRRAKFEAEKETKNTVRYAEKPPAGEAPIIGTLYIQKWWLQSVGSPATLLVELHVDEEQTGSHPGEAQD